MREALAKGHSVADEVQHLEGVIVGIDHPHLQHVEHHEDLFFDAQVVDQFPVEHGPSGKVQLVGAGELAHFEAHAVAVAVELFRPVHEHRRQAALPGTAVAQSAFRREVH